MPARVLNSVRLRRALRATYWLLANSAAAPLLRAPIVQRGRRRMTTTHVSRGDVIEVLGLLEAAQVTTWLAGGWACDALVGGQTREHSDLDLVVPDAHAPRAFEALRRRGFSIYERRHAGLLNCAVELID